MALFASNNELLGNLEMKSVDFRMRLKGDADVAETASTVVVLIDDAVLKQYPYRSPVPRQLLAKMIKELDRSGAKLIALDILLKDLSWKTEDALLRSAMLESGKVVLVSAMRDVEAGGTLDQANPYFLEAAIASGISDMPIDPADQVVRSMRPVWRVAGKDVPTLSMSLYLLSNGHDEEDLTAANIEQRFLLNSAYLIRMFEPPSTVSIQDRKISVYPASALLSGYLPEEWFKGKNVLIGAGYEDNTDSYRTPYYSGTYGWPLTPGVEIHAAALETLQQKGFIALSAKTLVFALAVGLGLLLLVLEVKTNSLLGGAFLVLILTGYGFIAVYRFEDANQALPFVPVSLALIVTYGMAVIYRALTEGRQKRWLQSAFGTYVSSDLVDMLVDRPDSMKLGGEEKEVTVLFSDLQGFTAISETMTPAHLVSLLNEYLEGMTEIILRHRGTLDKYQGDAIMAFWGAPVDDSEHALNAIKAALEMQQFSARLNERFRATGKPQLFTRIGINTGKVVVGNIGSKQRFDYTVIGDEVNLASRLEGANKAYATHLILGERTRYLAGEAVLVRELDLIQVKGKEIPVKIFEALSLANNQDDTEKKLCERFAVALEHYREGRWEEAEDGFLVLLDEKANDGPAQVFLERSRLYAKTPPPEGWGGVFVMQSK